MIEKWMLRNNIRYLSGGLLAIPSFVLGLHRHLNKINIYLFVFYIEIEFFEDGHEDD